MRTIPRILTGLALAGIIAFAGLTSAHAQDLSTSVSFEPITGATTPTQLAGLMVTNIDMAPEGSSIRYVLTATRTESVCPPAKPGMVACLAVARVAEYQIRVTANTSVLNKNRGTLVGDIQVGDRINAYGALENGGTRMNAQIVRDLDKPFSTQAVQLDGLRVVAVTQGKDGVQIHAVRGTGPCWNYLGASRLSYPCPAGTQPSPMVRAAAEKVKLDVADVYSISVPNTATVLDVNRKPIAHSNITEGVSINVYGTLVAPGMMQASIVRVLSETATSKLTIGVTDGGAQLRQGSKASVTLVARGGSETYRWSATDLPDGMQLESQATIYCIKAPCPQPATSEARITGTPSMPGTFASRILVTDGSGTTSYLEIPFTVTSNTDLVVSVKTDKSSYRTDQTMRVSVTVANEGDEAEEIVFNSGCQADYDVLPGFSLRAVQLCTASLTHMTLGAGRSKTYTFDHDFSAHPLPKMALPFGVEVVGRIPGVGEARTKVTIK